MLLNRPDGAHNDMVIAAWYHLLYIAFQRRDGTRQHRDIAPARCPFHPFELVLDGLGKPQGLVLGGGSHNVHR